MSEEAKGSMMKRTLGPALCAGLALSAIEAMAATQTPWSLRELAEAPKSDPTTQTGRLDAIGETIVGGQRASQTMGHAWYRLAERMEVDGEPLLEMYQREGLGEFLLAQQTGSSSAGSCYTACYGNCYGNCYSNCYSNCHSADS